MDGKLHDENAPLRVVTHKGIGTLILSSRPETYIFGSRNEAGAIIKPLQPRLSAEAVQGTSSFDKNYRYNLAERLGDFLQLPRLTGCMLPIPSLVSRSGDVIRIASIHIIQRQDMSVNERNISSRLQGCLRNRHAM